MGALINVFKNLLGGILGFLGGLIGGKKDKTAVAPAKKSKKPKRGKDGFFMVADDASMEEIPEVAPVMAAVTSEAAPDAKPAKAAKGKKDKGAVKAVAAAVPAAPRVMSAEELIVAALQPKPVDAAAAPVGTAGFATQYLVPTLTSGRRGPGPSLKGFKAMAKEIRG